MSLKSVNITDSILGGTPVLNGTRFAAARALLLHTRGQTAHEIAEEYGFDKKLITDLLEELADKIYEI